MIENEMERGEVFDIVMEEMLAEEQRLMELEWEMME